MGDDEFRPSVCIGCVHAAPHVGSIHYVICTWRPRPAPYYLRSHDIGGRVRPALERLDYPPVVCETREEPGA